LSVLMDGVSLTVSGVAFQVTGDECEKTR